MVLNGFTTTEEAILNKLADGKPHTKEELLAVMPDPEFANAGNLRTHIHRIRKKIQPKGHDVVSVYRYRVFSYQWVRLLASPYDGRK